MHHLRGRLYARKWLEPKLLRMIMMTMLMMMMMKMMMMLKKKMKMRMMISPGGGFVPLQFRLEVPGRVPTPPR